MIYCVLIVIHLYYFQLIIINTPEGQKSNDEEVAESFNSYTCYVWQVTGDRWKVTGDSWYNLYPNRFLLPRDNFDHSSSLWMGKIDTAARFFVENIERLKESIDPNYKSFCFRDEYTFSFIHSFIEHICYASSKPNKHSFSKKFSYLGIRTNRTNLVNSFYLFLPQTWQ